MTSTRRDFLRAASAAVVAPTVERSDTSPPQTRAVQYGMVIDLQKCIGCKACMIACKAENQTPPGVSYMVVLEQEVGRYPHVRRVFIPRPCMQCQKPSCTQVCPTQATYRRPDGVVVVDYDKCIGCRYCMAACPYGARSFDFGHMYHSPCEGSPARGKEEFLGNPTPWEELRSPEYGEYRNRSAYLSPYHNVRKCHFCLHRVKKGLLPACASACPGRAIYFGDLNDPQSLVYRVRDEQDPVRVWLPNFPGRTVMQLRPETGNDPAVYYLT